MMKNLKTLPKKTEEVEEDVVVLKINDQRKSNLIIPSQEYILKNYIPFNEVPHEGFLERGMPTLK